MELPEPKPDGVVELGWVHIILDVMGLEHFFYFHTCEVGEHFHYLNNFLDNLGEMELGF